MIDPINDGGSEFIPVSHTVVAHDRLSDHKVVVAEFEIQ
jgi:hypothetical protein